MVFRCQISAICTCSYEAALGYPADVIIDYLVRRFLHGVRRAQGGTKEVFIFYLLVPIN
jgi:hypothetical protein